METGNGFYIFIGAVVGIGALFVMVVLAGEFASASRESFANHIETDCKNFGAFSIDGRKYKCVPDAMEGE